MAMGNRMKVPAHEVKAGDFTIFSGYRHVVDVRAASRGESDAPWERTKERLPRIALVRTGAEGDSPRIDRVHRDQLITVFRQAVPEL